MATVAEQISYTDLYARWEKGNWRATEIDFTEDRRQWHEEMTEFERQRARSGTTPSSSGARTPSPDGLSPYIAAAPTEEQKYFLATQQVDEARHAVFFNRFMHEVCDLGDGTVGRRAGSDPAAAHLGLPAWCSIGSTAWRTSCATDPSLPRLSAAITLYHVVIEATLAQPGQHFITSYLHDRDLLPGFREGMDRIAQDEQRHIAFGVKLLSDLAAGDPECRRAVADLLREVLPWTASVLVPPDWNLDYTRVFGFELEDIAQRGRRLARDEAAQRGPADRGSPGPADLRLRAAAPRRACATACGWCRAASWARRTARRQTITRRWRRCSRCSAPASSRARRPTSRARSCGTSPTPSRGTSSSPTATPRFEPGRVEAPTVTLRCRYEDWADVFAKREHPLRLAATRRLRPSGDMRWLWRARRMFPR